MFVSVKICDILEFVKRLFKVLTKFHGKNIGTMGTECILKNGDPTPFLIKMGAETKSFVCNDIRWKRKIRQIPFLCKRGIYRPNYATFSMKRFLLMSVYIMKPTVLISVWFECLFLCVKFSQLKLWSIYLRKHCNFAPW